MASRIVARVGRNVPKTLLSFRSAVSTTDMLMKHATASSSQIGVQQLTVFPGQNSSFVSVRAFSDSKPPPTEEDKSEKADELSAEGAAGADEEAAETGGKTEADLEVPREEQLEAELKQVKDQLLRSLAEAENTRRIAQRDVQDARNFAVKSFAKSLLDTSDNLTRAMEVVPEEMRHDKENNSILVNLYEGIEMTEKELMKAFEKNGLKKYGNVGDKFDPNQHEALYEYPDPEKEAGTIGQVIKPGYTLNERVLRPAEVGVVKKE